MKTKLKKIILKIKNPVKFIMKLYNDDQVMTNAACITLFMIMSVFPMLMILLWVMSRFLISPEFLVNVIKEFLPDKFMPLIISVIEDLYAKTLSTSALSLTIIMALWSSSTGISFLVVGLNNVYKRIEQRNWFLHRGLCLMYTGIFLIVILLVLGFIVFGHHFQNFLITIYPPIEGWLWLVGILQNIMAIAAMVFFFLAVYNIFPQKKLPYIKQLPGSIVATIGWYGFSAIYSYYIKTSEKLAYMYGSLTIIIVFLIWLYVCINIILIGGEVNFLYNNRYYYKLFLLTENQIDIQEYYMRTEPEKSEAVLTDSIDEEENNRQWQQPDELENPPEDEGAQAGDEQVQQEDNQITAELKEDDNTAGTEEEKEIPVIASEDIYQKESDNPVNDAPLEDEKYT